MTKIWGKSDIYSFKILLYEEEEIRAFDVLSVAHVEYGDILSQDTNISRNSSKLIGECRTIGYREHNILKNIKTPFRENCEIKKAEDKFICKILGLKLNSKNFIGILEDHPNLKLELELKKIITKHICILAKSGAGKSYTVGVILEEIIKKNIPILILDPHGEYSSLKYKNDNEKDINRLSKFGLEPVDFFERIREYSPDTKINANCEKISLDITKLSNKDFMDLIPQKLSPSQESLLYNILTNTVTGTINLDELIFHISNEESPAKWTLINLIEQMKKLALFSTEPTKLNDLIKPKRVSIINLKGVDPQIGEIFVAQILKNLFMARKREEIPPFFLVIEEAHNFIPERNLGELKTSKIIRNIAAEGRKFGLGICVISQRPAKLDKNVLSQCSTQIILKITNPSDLKSVIQSGEGITNDSAQEIQRLNIGTALLSGVIDIPLKVNIRPKITKHGGETVDIALDYEKKLEEEKDIEIVEIEDDEKVDGINKLAEFVEFIENPIINFDKKVILSPCVIFEIKDKENKKINLLIDLVKQKIITNINTIDGINLNFNLEKLSNSQKDILLKFCSLKEPFNPTELLLKTNYNYNEIIKITQILNEKKIIKVFEKGYKINETVFLKDVSNLNFKGVNKFEEIKFNKKNAPTILQKEVEKLIGDFFEIANIKEIYILENI